jgi:type VI secretion system protein ImpG
MSEDLLHYYDRELLFIRKMAQEFARQYPVPAGRLLLEPNQSRDPHVERLIEAFALLSGRIHHKLDDEFPELTDALLSVLYPHYLAPIPSMAVIQFELDSGRAQLPDGFLIDRYSRLHTRPIKGLPCKFRTCYPVKLWPITVAEARLLSPPFPRRLQPPQSTAAVLTLRLECQSGMSFAGLSLDRLRFYLSGDNQVIPLLYELLFNNTLQVVFQPLDAKEQLAPLVFAPNSCLFPVGFERDEGLLPYPNQSFLGYRLLTEFFTFPNKFWFVDLGGFEKARRAGFGKSLEVVFYLNRTSANLEKAVEATTFRLGCTPVINLFEQTAEPISLTHARHEYRVVPDVTQNQGMEVYSIDSVTSTDPVTSTVQEYQAFYSFRHGQSRETQRAFWYASRRASFQEKDEKDNATEVYLHLVDLGFNPALPDESVLVVRTTCTNRNLPKDLQGEGEKPYFELEAAAPLSGIPCLRTPTLPLRPRLRRGAYWSLLSHLNLNHLSLSDAEEGRAALQEILRLYDFSDAESGPQLAAVTHHIIEGIAAVSSRRVVGRIGGATASGFCRGLEVAIEFDEQKYVGIGVYLFACVLERFLGLYTSINSFTQLVARIGQGEGYLKKWPPRAAEHQLL